LTNLEAKGDKKRVAEIKSLFGKRIWEGGVDGQNQQKTGSRKNILLGCSVWEGGTTGY